ncbi:MAG: hypothetical protein FWH04_03090 [Oscillospiraceae bacterium]|nr:hypothetical protein [Oscillospiraceae bacterium]
MFTLVEIKTTNASSVPIFNWLRRRKSRKKEPLFVLTQKASPSYFHLLVLFPPDASEQEQLRRIRAGLREAAEKNSTALVLPKSFPFPHLPREMGFPVCSPYPLLRRLSGQICTFAAEGMGISPSRLRVALIGRRLTPEMSEAAQRLTKRARILYMYAGNDTRAACHALRSITGAAVGELGREQADIYVLFAVPDIIVPIHGRTLCLNFSGCAPIICGGILADGAVLAPPCRLFDNKEYDQPSLLWALVLSGNIDLPDLDIKGICQGERLLELRGLGIPAEPSVYA